MPFFSTEMSIETLQLLVPLVPFIGAVATIILGRVLGSKAHIPAIASIAIAAAAALVLLAVEVERVTSKVERVTSWMEPAGGSVGGACCCVVAVGCWS